MEGLLCHAVISGLYPVRKQKLLKVFKKVNVFQNGLCIWTEVGDIVQETGIKTIPMEKKCKESKMAVWLIGKDSNAGRDWGQEKKGTTEDEGHDFG